MEEDINILEGVIRRLKREHFEDGLSDKYYKALENLIKGYKELEKDYIPKSKVKEKINAYSKSCAVVDAFIVDVLQELMEDK